MNTFGTLNDRSNFNTQSDAVEFGTYVLARDAFHVSCAAGIYQQLRYVAYRHLWRVLIVTSYNIFEYVGTQQQVIITTSGMTR